MTQVILKNKYEYRRRLPHYQKDNHAIFVSFRLGGPDVLSGKARDIVLKHCLHDHETKAHFHAVVAMPDRVASPANAHAQPER